MERGSAHSAFVRAVVCCLGICAAGAGLSAQSIPAPPSTGTVVAIVELGAPPVQGFVLRATLPIPGGLFPRDDGRSPFQVIDSDGTLVPAETEIVSRYPRAIDGADVVELLAHVTRGADVAPDARIRYQIVYQPIDPPAFVGQADIDQLLATPDALTLRTRDCFGNRYTADLYEPVRIDQGQRYRTLRDGSVAKQTVNHQVLQPAIPIDGSQGTLPHMMGVHTYLTRWSEEAFFSLDLRVHSALSGLDANDPDDDPMGKLYFQTLELLLPEGWVLLNSFDDPFFGAPYSESGHTVWPIVAPLAGGKLHVMPLMGQMERRLVVARAGAEPRALIALREKGLAFVQPASTATGQPLWSWWNSETARYFPQRVRLPTLDHLGDANLRALDDIELASRSAQVSSGAAGIWPATSPGLGWAHPWGIEDGGMVSGEEIFILDGMITAAAASNSGYRMHQLAHRMYTDRQRNVLFDRGGLPTALEHWLVPDANGPYNPVWWYNDPMLWANDPFGIGNAPQFQVNYVQANNLVAPYETALTNFMPIDEAHLIRYIHNAKALVWLGNDALAKDDLRAQAEGFHFAYNEYPMNPGGYAIVSGMLAARNYIAVHPGWGFPFSRAEGWGIDVTNAAYSTQDEDFRAKLRPWYALILDTVEQGQCTCTGVIQSTPFTNVFNSQYRCRQSIEAAIQDNALVGMRESVFERQSPDLATRTDEVLKKSIYAMISPLIWDPVQNGPGAMLALGDFNTDLPPYCTYVPSDGTYGFPDHYQIWSSFVYAYQITGDIEFLNKATAALGGSLLPALEATGLDNLPNRAALLGLAQTLH